MENLFYIVSNLKNALNGASITSEIKGGTDGKEALTVVKLAESKFHVTHYYIVATSTPGDPRPKFTKSIVASFVFDMV